MIERFLPSLNDGEHLCRRKNIGLGVLTSHNRPENGWQERRHSKDFPFQRAGTLLKNSRCINECPRVFGHLWRTLGAFKREDVGLRVGITLLRKDIHYRDETLVCLSLSNFFCRETNGERQYRLFGSLDQLLSDLGRKTNVVEEEPSVDNVRHDGSRGL